MIWIKLLCVVLSEQWNSEKNWIFKLDDFFYPSIQVSSSGVASNAWNLSQQAQNTKLKAMEIIQIALHCIASHCLARHRDPIKYVWILVWAKIPSFARKMCLTAACFFCLCVLVLPLKDTHFSRYSLFLFLWNIFSIAFASLYSRFSQLLLHNLHRQEISI